MPHMCSQRTRHTRPIQASSLAWQRTLRSRHCSKIFTQSAGLKSAADWPMFWYVGGHATGTNFHSHPNAYNALIFGKKHW